MPVCTGTTQDENPFSGETAGGDGAGWIWQAAARFLALGRVQSVEIVDIFHVWEHLWTVAHAVFRPGSAAAAAWAEPLTRRLAQEGVGPVWAALSGLGPPSRDAAEDVRKVLGSFTEHAARMD